jgi:hypothetical protein
MAPPWFNRTVINITLAASIGDQNVSYDARQHHHLVVSRQSKKKTANRMILVVLGQTGLVLHGNSQIRITKLLCRVMTVMERMEMVTN